MKYFCFLLVLLFCLGELHAQSDSNEVRKPETTHVTQPIPRKDSVRKPQVHLQDTIKKNKVDSLHIKDSLARSLALADSLKKDSLQKIAQATVPAIPVKDTSTYAAMIQTAHLPFNQPPVFMITKEREPQTKNELFYLLTGVVFLVAFVKLFFPKYFQNLFRLFFQTSFRQKQTRDQLLQDNLASLLMNLLFFISGGIYIGLVAQEMELVEIPFWNLLLYCSLLLGIIYLGKYLFLRFSGWVFNVKEAAGTYIFVVFLINKIVGVLLVPFLLLLAFSVRPVVQLTATVSLILVAAMLVYRYLVSMGTIRRDLKVSALHFFLYLCAVEILPLLLIYKTLFNYISKNV